MRMLRMLFFICLAACAPWQMPAQGEPAVEGSVVPGTVGVAVERSGDGVVVSAVRSGSAAERAGIRAGDRVVRYNGEPISDVRQFERLVLDSVPGSLAHIEVLRDGSPRTIQLLVEQVRTADRA